MLKRLYSNTSDRVKKLGDKITTSEQLETALKDLPGFRGTYDRVGFFKAYPHFVAGDSAIINLDPRYKNGGTHWVAIRISTDGTTILYKDSFGAPPPEAFYKNLGRPVLYGNSIFQKLTEQNCGKRSAEMLTSLSDAKKDDISLFYRIA